CPAAPAPAHHGGLSARARGGGAEGGDVICVSRASAARPGTQGGRAMIDCYFVYILASRRNGTLYIGVTNDLVRRMGEHKAKLVPGFTRKYGVDRLVYFEEYSSLEARARERSLKRWQRAWKIELIEKLNPQWRDLTGELAI